MVGLAGLEPATSRPPDERATRLRYSPNQARIAGMRPLLQGLSVDFAGFIAKVPPESDPCDCGCLLTGGKYFLIRLG